jgi:two-component system, response regulator YesN
MISPQLRKCRRRVAAGFHTWWCLRREASPFRGEAGMAVLQVGGMMEFQEQEKSEKSNSEILCKITRNFYDLTGLRCSFRILGEEHDCRNCSECHWNVVCAFCFAAPKYEQECTKQTFYAEREAQKMCQPYIYLCPLGMVKFAVPVIQGNQHIGTIIAGCVRISRRIREEDEKPRHFDYFHLPWQTYTETWNALPYFTTQQIQYAAQTLFSTVCFFMNTDRKLLEKELKRQKEETDLYDKIVLEKNEIARTVSAFTDSKHEKKEQQLFITKNEKKEILGKVLIKDRVGAKNILDKIWSRIYFENPERLQEIKTGLIELIVSIGAELANENNQEVLFDFYQKIFAELKGLNNTLDVSVWMKRTVDALIALAEEREHVNKKSNLPVAEIAECINLNYMNDLTLEMIAEKVGYSTFYIAHTFKEETGISILDYLTEVRIAKAKDMLKNSDDLVAVIAEKVGYQYSHYFARTFKKKVGITPSEYRRWWIKTQK